MLIQKTTYFSNGVVTLLKIFENLQLTNSMQQILHGHQGPNISVLKRTNPTTQ